MKRSNHPVGSYFGNLGIGIILVVVILGACLFGWIDQSSHESKQNRQVVRDAGNAAKGIYKDNSGKFADYARQRTNNDLQKAEPKVEQISHTSSKILNSHGRTPVSNIALNDEGNGSLMMKGHKYAFQLANIQFAPHNSKFYQANQTNIYNIITNSLSNGKFYITRVNGSQIYLYKNQSLLTNQYLRDGIAYIPNLNQSKFSMRMAERYAKVRRAGIWKVPHIISNNHNNQTYKTSSESGHSIARLHTKYRADNSKSKIKAKSKRGKHGGRSVPQSINHWLSQH